MLNISGSCIRFQCASGSAVAARVWVGRLRRAAQDSGQLGMGDQLIGVGAALFGQSGATYHSGDFVASFGGTQRTDAGDGATGQDLLFHAEVVLSISSDLGEVADAQHLLAVCQAADLATDAIGGGSTYAGVDFIEHHRVAGVATDAGRLSEPTAVDEVLIAPGERVEVTVALTEGRHELRSLGYDRGSAGMAGGMMGGRSGAGSGPQVLAVLDAAATSSAAPSRRNPAPLSHRHVPFLPFLPSCPSFASEWT